MTRRLSYVQRGQAGLSWRSALCILPHLSLWEPIQRIRVIEDRNFRKWMPHIKLLYPFRPGRSYPKLVHDLAGLVKNQRPIRSNLSHFEHVQFKPQRFDVFVRPSARSSEELRMLHYKLVGEYSDCTDTMTGGEYIPRITVGTYGEMVKVRAVKKAYNETWDVVPFVVDRMFLLSQKSIEDPFQVQAMIPFGGAPPKLANEDPHFAKAAAYFSDSSHWSFGSTF